MTLVRNVDGDYVASNPYDHCKHGAYVGGCGYDFMCHACEMGDPDITINDLRRQLERSIDDLIELWDLCRQIAHDPVRGLVGDPGALQVTLFEAYIASTGRTAADNMRLVPERIECLELLVTGPDDDNYLSRLHNAECERWHRQVIAWALDEGYTRASVKGERYDFISGPATPEQFPLVVTPADMGRLYERYGR